MDYLKYITKYLKRSQRLALIITIIYQANVVLFLLYQMLSIMSTKNPGDCYLSMRIFRSVTLQKLYARAFPSTCKLDNSNIVRDGYQHTKTTEDK